MTEYVLRFKECKTLDVSTGNQVYTSLSDATRDATNASLNKVYGVKVCKLVPQEIEHPNLRIVRQELLDRFSEALRFGTGCQQTCVCGKMFYNSDPSCSWKDGELEKLFLNPNAQAKGWSCSSFYLDGKEYANDCDCWHERASEIIKFIWAHAHGVARFINGEKKMAQTVASAMPEVNEG